MSEYESPTLPAARVAVDIDGMLRGLGVMALTGLAMIVADFAVSYFVVVGFMSNPTSLIGIPIAAVILAAIVVRASKVLTGRPHVLGAAGATLLLAGVGAYGFLNGILSPLSLQEGGLLHIAVCALCAFSLGLRVGPWPLRIVGAAALAGAIVLMSVLPTASERAAVEAAHTQTQRAADRVDYFLTSGTFPVVTNLDGWSNARLRATGGDANTWIVSSDGGVAEVLVTGNVSEKEMDPHAPCTWMLRPGDGGASTPGALPAWCLRTDVGWARADGTGISFVENGRLIAINTPDDDEIRGVKGNRPASAEEIAGLASSLRPMTRSEINEFVLPTYAGLDSPTVNTPGL